MKRAMAAGVLLFGLTGTANAEALPSPAADYRSKGRMAGGMTVEYRHSNGKMRMEMRSAEMPQPMVGYFDVKTQKGNGYEVTKNEPTKFHSPAAFRVEGSPLVQNGCRVEINKGSGKNWTSAFADAAIAVAKRDLWDLWRHHVIPQ